MASKSDRELKKEIAYLTNLIESHKKTSAMPQCKQTQPLKQSSLKTNKFKWSAASASKFQRNSSNSVPHSSVAPLSVSTHTTVPAQSSLTSNESRTVIPSCNHTLPPTRNTQNPNIYRYNNRHHQNTTVHNHGNHPRSHRHGNQGNINRKWSNKNKVYTPTVVKDDTVEPKHEKLSTTNLLAKNSTLSTSSTHTIVRKKKEHVGQSGKSNTAASQTSLHGNTSMIKSHIITQNPPKQNEQGNTQAVIPAETSSPSTQPPSTPSSSSSSPFHPPRRRVSSGSNSCSRYRWRRRSTPSSPSSKRKSSTSKSPFSRSVLKSPTLISGNARPHLPSWIIHNKYKLTHASIVHKYNKIMLRQRTNTKTHGARTVIRRTPLLTPTSKKSRHTHCRPRNKVWRASDDCKTDTKSSTSIKRQSPSRHISGHELKTKQGNRLWVSKRIKRSTTNSQFKAGTIRTQPSNSPRVSSTAHPPRRLSGHELKTRQGNRQWVSKRLVLRKRRSLQLMTHNHTRGSTTVFTGPANSAVCRRRSFRGPIRQLVHNTQLVSLSGGQKFVVDSGRHRMKRISLSSSSISPSSPFSLSSHPSRPRLLSRTRMGSESQTIPAASIKQYLASRAVQRSRVYVWSAKKRKKREAKHYCIFYNRFGKCNRGNACPYIHDPSKIAVCTKFLRGMCDKTDGSCLFSHTISKDKMPTCSFFLRGVCTRDVCPYRHVCVGRHAEVCLDFARGYCPNGEECHKQHVINCPDFTERGRCPRGTKCPLRHRAAVKVAVTTKQQTAVAPTRTPLAFKRFRRKLRLESDMETCGTGMRQSSEADNDDTDDESSSDDDRQLSPLDPNCPAPDFLSL